MPERVREDHLNSSYAPCTRANVLTEAFRGPYTLTGTMLFTWQVYMRIVRGTLDSERYSNIVWERFKKAVWFPNLGTAVVNLPHEHLKISFCPRLPCPPRTVETRSLRFDLSCWVFRLILRKSTTVCDIYTRLPKVPTPPRRLHVARVRFQQSRLNYNTGLASLASSSNC